MSGKLIKNECFAVKKVSKSALKSGFAFPFARTRILKPPVWVVFDFVGKGARITAPCAGTDCEARRHIAAPDGAVFCQYLIC